VYYNPDGRESSMCGNGGRCIVAFAEKMGIVKAKYLFNAIDGLHEATKSGEIVKLRMTKPQGFRTIDSNTFWLNTGSPHYVQIREADIDTIDVKKEGAAIRYSADFQAEGTNVNFVNIIDKAKLKVRTYERGVEDETLSCGTGVTACAYTYIIWHNKTTKVEVQTLGGNLSVEVIDFYQDTEEVWLVGAATFVYEGNIKVLPTF
jgi:diaminopimelate epimerase